MPVTDEAIDKIKAMIVAGELPPGAKIPREKDLAERLGLSRNSLREAVRALSLVKVLDVRQGDGTYVTSLEPDLLLDSITFAVEVSRDDSVLQILAVRRELEAAATAMAATRLGDDDLAELRRLMAAMTAEGAAVEELVQADMEFHRTIARASGNRVLASLLEALSSQTMQARVWRGRTEEGALAQTHRDHERIYGALAARDPTLARAAATVHVAGVEAWLRRAAALGEGEG